MTDSNIDIGKSFRKLHEQGEFTYSDSAMGFDKLNKFFSTSED